MRRWFFFFWGGGAFLDVFAVSQEMVEVCVVCIVWWRGSRAVGMLVRVVVLGGVGIWSADVWTKVGVYCRRWRTRMVGWTHILGGRGGGGRPRGYFNTGHWIFGLDDITHHHAAPPPQSTTPPPHAPPHTRPPYTPHPHLQLTTLEHHPTTPHSTTLHPTPSPTAHHPTAEHPTPSPTADHCTPHHSIANHPTADHCTHNHSIPDHPTARPRLKAPAAWLDPCWTPVESLLMSLLACCLVFPWGQLTETVPAGETDIQVFITVVMLTPHIILHVLPSCLQPRDTLLDQYSCSSWAVSLRTLSYQLKAGLHRWESFLFGCEDGVFGMKQFPRPEWCNKLANWKTRRTSRATWYNGSSGGEMASFLDDVWFFQFLVRVWVHCDLWFLSCYFL